MQYSPKLKKAAEEINSILNKYDIAGSIILHTPGFAEYIFKINPSYSCATMEAEGIRIKAKLADFNGDVEKRNKKIEDTVNMISLIHTTTDNQLSMLRALVNLLKSKIEFDEGPLGHTSHNQQNN